uniref:Transmembrane protein n=1 Tax=Neobodo designis TaxID=312471 RepID=A0A7S1LJZ1_NEODS
MWPRLRVPLVFPRLVPIWPDALFREWSWRTLPMVVVVAFIYAAVSVAAFLPRSVVSTRTAQVAALGVVCAALCPLWMLGWGLGCLAAYDPDVCLMGEDSVVILIVLGMCSSLVCLGVCCRVCILDD